jgi:chorismate mutase
MTILDVRLRRIELLKKDYVETLQGFQNAQFQRGHPVDTRDIGTQLSTFRQTIDNIDAALIHMLAERFRCTDQVGLLKAKYQLPAVDKEREQRQYERLTRLAEEANLDPGFVEKLMEFVISEVVQRHRQIAAVEEAASHNQDPVIQRD